MRDQVLVLGGSCFIGYHIVQCLQESGYNVTVLNRGTRNVVFREPVRTIRCDRKKRDDLKRLLENETFKYVVDVSGYTLTDAQYIYEAINLSTLKKYIFISSSAVYCPSKEFPIKEDAPTGKNEVWADYGENKLEMERYFLSKHEKSEFPVVILRPPYVYGEYNYVYREAFIFDQIMTGNPIFVPGNGEALVQFFHAEDMAHTVCKVMTADDTAGRTLNVGNDSGITFNQWIRACMKACGKQINLIPFDYRSAGYECRDFFPFHDYSYVLDVTRAKDYYIPQITLEEGLRRSYNWYIQNNQYVEDKRSYMSNVEKILKETGRNK